VYSVFVVIIFLDLFRFLTSGIRALIVLFFGVFHRKMYFTGKCDGPSIESFIKERKSRWEDTWPHWVDLKLQGDAAIWWKSLDYKEMMTLSNGEFEKILLDKWSHGENKDKERTKSLFSCEKSILQVHGCILSLFLLSLVACIILSMFSWLIDCKFQ
jgi:hypothetical protein